MHNRNLSKYITASQFTEYGVLSDSEFPPLEYMESSSSELHKKIYSNPWSESVYECRLYGYCDYATGFYLIDNSGQPNDSCIPLNDIVVSYSLIINGTEVCTYADEHTTSEIYKGLYKLNILDGKPVILRNLDVQISVKFKQTDNVDVKNLLIIYDRCFCKYTLPQYFTQSFTYKQYITDKLFDTSRPSKFALHNRLVGNVSNILVDFDPPILNPIVNYLGVQIDGEDVIGDNLVNPYAKWIINGEVHTISTPFNFDQMDNCVLCVRIDKSKTDIKEGIIKITGNSIGYIKYANMPTTVSHVMIYK